MEVTYVAICFGYWGRGKTEAIARAQLKKSGGKAKDFTIIYRVEYEAGKAKPYVDDAGSLCFFGVRQKIAEIKNGKRRELKAIPIRGDGSADPLAMSAK